MNINKITEYLDDEIIMFDNYSYDTAFVGVSYDNRAIYDYEKMIKYLMDKKFTHEEAIEWIDYNTFRALPYMGEKAPIILFTKEYFYEN